MIMKRRKKNKRESLQKGIYLLPNLCTTGSLFFGFFSIIKSLNGDFVLAAWAILISGIFDMLDGRLARLTRGVSQFGVAYDSLVDLASFGLAPALLIYTWSLVSLNKLGWLVAFLFFACGALRLARYNVQSANVELKHFQGLPIPMAAYSLATTVIFYEHVYTIPPKNDLFILIETVMLALLMVSNLRYRSLKEIELKGRLPFFALVVLVAVIALLAFRPPWTLWIGTLGYVLWGVLENTFLLFRKEKKMLKETKPLSIVTVDKQSKTS